jgi:hypothetical protein
VSPANPWLDTVVQKTYVRVDEEGTEAAAVTGGALRPPRVRPRSGWTGRSCSPSATARPGRSSSSAPSTTHDPDHRSWAWPPRRKNPRRRKRARLTAGGGRRLPAALTGPNRRNDLATPGVSPRSGRSVRRPVPTPETGGRSLRQDGRGAPSVAPSPSVSAASSTGSSSIGRPSSPYAHSEGCLVLDRAELRPLSSNDNAPLPLWVKTAIRFRFVEARHTDDRRREPDARLMDCAARAG